MLLKYHYNSSHLRTYILNLLVVIAVAFSSLVTYAQELAGEGWQVHGFLAQGIIDVDHSSYVSDSGKVSAELTELGINGSYKVTDNLRLTGQIVYLDGGNRYVDGARIDYALLDYGVFNDDEWLVNLYLGRFKNNNWLYSSTRDVPHARPSIILPQSVYFDGFRDIAMGSDGIALKVSRSIEGLGDFDFYANYGASSLDTEDVKLLLGDLVQGRGKQEYDAQMGIYWQPEFSSWQFGFSLLDSEFNYKRAETDLFANAEFSFQQYTTNALYEGESWEFSAELFQQRFVQKGFYFQDYLLERVGQGAYFQTRYQFNSQLSLLARYERFWADKDDKNGKKTEKATYGLVPSYFGYQNDVTIGASYDLSDSLRLQVEHHWVQGTSRLTPIVFPDIEVNNRESWSLWAAQIMYWF